MIEIYNEENEYLISVHTEQQLVGFMYDHELDFKTVIIKENGMSRTITFDEMTILGVKAKVLKYSEYYHMKKICSLADVNYHAFKRWKDGMDKSVSIDEMLRIMKVMESIGSFCLREVDEELEKERQY